MFVYSLLVQEVLEEGAIVNDTDKYNYFQGKIDMSNKIANKIWNLFAKSGSYTSISKWDFIKKHGLLQSEYLGFLLAL